jgi:hypothetical protein
VQFRQSWRSFEIAEQEQGFFTTKQAKVAGFADLALWTLWSRDRNEGVAGVYSRFVECEPVEAPHHSSTNFRRN